MFCFFFFFFCLLEITFYYCCMCHSICTCTLCIFVFFCILRNSYDSLSASLCLEQRPLVRLSAFCLRSVFCTGTERKKQRKKPERWRPKQIF
uniref:Secreted protein n=1 Tax=Rhipicephalus microplus TaxID=6941 RepID=A0A6M2DA78_RHIMP